ncbi:MAG: site-specific integrase [Acidiferrobacteraceae bacterium]
MRRRSALAKPSPSSLEKLVGRAADYAKLKVSATTREGYARDFARFAAWAADKKLASLPTTPEIVAVYLAALADGEVAVRWTGRGGKQYESKVPKSYATLDRALAAIIFAQRDAGHDWPHAHPAIVRVMHGIAREVGTAQKKAAPLEVDDLRACLILCPSTIAGARDRALLALGFFGALRRSELVALTVRDIEFCPEGLVLKIRKSKTDQLRAGRDVPVPTMKHARVCPVRLLRAWMEAGEIAEGPLFRRIDRGGNVATEALSDQSVTLIIKRVARLAGLDPARFSGHSLRAGFVTSAAASGRSLHNIMRQTGHRNEHVAMTYIRPATVWDDNAADGLA